MNKLSLFLLTLTFLFLVSSCGTQKNNKEETLSEQNEIEPTTPTEMEETSSLKGAENVIFKAMGTEPFWAVTIGEDKRIKVSSIDQNEFNIDVPVKEILKMNDGQGMTFTTAEPDLRLSLTIIPDGCRDAMKGDYFSHQVQMSVKTNKMKQEELYRGCGNFQGDFRLFDTWELVSIDGNTLQSEAKPYLTFYYDNSKFSGHTGCNVMNGDVVMNHNTIEMDKIGVTKMACRDKDNPESLFLNALTEPKFEYQLTSANELVMTSSEKKMTFKRKIKETR